MCKIQLSVKYIVHLLVICCEYIQNARYTQLHSFSNCAKHQLKAKQ